MSEIVTKAVEKLREKLGDGFDGKAKFEIEGEGSILIDESGVREADEDADVTLMADAETFAELLGGDLDPAAAFMGGRLTVDGDMGLAMKLGTALG